MNIVTCKDIVKSFSAKRTMVKAVDGVSISIEKGATYGLVGESGSGKTTLGKIILGILRPDSGTVNITAKNMQVIFQDPYNSLDPKMRVDDILSEGLVLSGAGFDKKRVDEILDVIKLSKDALKKYPHQFSGGERQRIAIGRAVITNPEFVVCDEPVSSLDVTIQLQILKLLKEVQKKFGITYLFISHDLRVIRFMCDKVAIMKEGKVVEEGGVQEVYANPSTIYARQLLSSVLNIVSR